MWFGDVDKSSLHIAPFRDMFSVSETLPEFQTYTSGLKPLLIVNEG